MGELPEYIDGLPDICGSEQRIEEAIRARGTFGSSEGLAPQNYSGSIRHSDENGWLPPAPWTVVAGRASCQILVGGRRDSGPPGSTVSRRAGRRYDS